MKVCPICKTNRGWHYGFNSYRHEIKVRCKPRSEWIEMENEIMRVKTVMLVVER